LISKVVGPHLHFISRVYTSYPRITDFEMAFLKNAYKEKGAGMTSRTTRNFSDWHIIAKTTFVIIMNVAL